MSIARQLLQLHSCYGSSQRVHRRVPEAQGDGASGWGTARRPRIPRCRAVPHRPYRGYSSARNHSHTATVQLHCNTIHSLLAHGHTRQQERKPAQDWSSSGWSRYRRARQIHRIQRAKHAPSGRRAYPHSSPEHAAIRIWKGTCCYSRWRLSLVELQPVQGPPSMRPGDRPVELQPVQGPSLARQRT